MKQYDIAIIGAGIAGASLAAEIAAKASVVILEAEERPGFHATGRSAAFWSETYGGPGVQPLTTASQQDLEQGGFLSPLGSIHIGRREDRPAMEAFLDAFRGSNVLLEEVDPALMIPGLRAEWILGVHEPSCSYIDAAGLLAACLRRARRAGATLVCNAAVQALKRQTGGWLIETRAGHYRAEILVNAAGAWADGIAGLAGAPPLGITPYRRTMVQLRTDPPAPNGLPHVADISGKFYFKPEAAGKIWLSPHDEIPSSPCDAAPEDIDVATAIDRFQHAVDWQVEALEHKWAGLRSFAPDRLPVYGFDPALPGFFWCAGQGGFGIQTAPAAARLAGSLLLKQPPETSIKKIDLARYAPDRFRQPPD